APTSPTSPTSGATLSRILDYRRGRGGRGETNAKDSWRALVKRVSKGNIDMSYQFSGWVMRTALVMALLSRLRAPAAGQSPRGAGSLPMEPYGQLAGCSEEPAQFHRCALAKAKGFDLARAAERRP